jgi:signal transduction histidine kinase
MPENLRKSLKAFAQSLWVYLVLAALLTFVIAGVSGLREPSLLSSVFVGNLALSVCIGASVTLAFALTTTVLSSGAPAFRSRAERLPSALRLTLACGLFVVAVSGGIELALQVLTWLAPSMRPWFSRTAVWIVALPVSVVMYFLGRLKERAELHRTQRHELEAQREEAKLAALLARTHPHFLFNSLNSIAALVDEDPKTAERALIQLASLFRYVLEGARSSSVRLRDELAFVRDYVALEELRFGERLRMEIDVDPTLGDAEILPLLVQPLVENAIRHGVASKSTPGHVRLRVRALTDALRIEVDDDGPGPFGSQHRGTGTSQLELEARLQLAYGGRARFTTGVSDLGGFRATLELPRKAA